MLLMPSKNFNVRLPENLQSALFRHIREAETSNFIRAAVAEKISRDFGEKVEVAEMSRGARNDMKTAEGKAAAERVLERARRRKEDFACVRRGVNDLFKAIPRAVRLRPSITAAKIKFKFSNGESYSYTVDLDDFSKNYYLLPPEEGRKKAHAEGVDYDLSRECFEKMQKDVREGVENLLNRMEGGGVDIVGFRFAFE